MSSPHRILAIVLRILIFHFFSRRVDLDNVDITSGDSLCGGIHHNRTELILHRRCRRVGQSVVMIKTV